MLAKLPVITDFEEHLMDSGLEFCEKWFASGLAICTGSLDSPNESCDEITRITLRAKRWLDPDDVQNWLFREFGPAIIHGITSSRPYSEPEGEIRMRCGDSCCWICRDPRGASPRSNLVFVTEDTLDALVPGNGVRVF
jgi:hypothetical protein